MDLEKLLAKDRVEFETTILPLQDKPVMQSNAGVQYISKLIDEACKNPELMSVIKVRVDALMGLAVKYKVSNQLALHFLKSTTSSASEYINRPELAAYTQQTDTPYLTIEELFSEPESLHASDAMLSAVKVTDPLKEINAMRTRNLFNKLVQLEALCEEYNTWMARMNALLPTANPKNHPTVGQLRERDAIRAKINEIATPEVIAYLVKIARKERGVL